MKTLTTKPVAAAAMTVPSRTPATVPMSAIDATTANPTQPRSKPTFVRPKLHPVMLVTAHTNASPLFMTTFATTVHATPNASTATPAASTASDAG